MKRRLHVPQTLSPLTTVAHGYEYYSRTSAYGMVYLRKKLGDRGATEVIIKNRHALCVSILTTITINPALFSIFDGDRKYY